MLQTYVVRHGQMRLLGEFVGLPERNHARGECVVARTDRGTELGEILCPATERAAKFLENPTRGEILRSADAENLAAEAILSERAREGATVCRDLIDKRRLRMDLVDVEAILGGERMVFYYLAESASISVNLSKTSRASSEPESKCGRSAFATKPSSWPTTATAASRSAVIPISRACRPSP